MKEKNTIFFNNERKARLIPALVVAIALPFMIFVVSPLEVYKNGLEELVFKTFDFMWVLIAFFVILSSVNFAVLFFTPKTVYRVLYVFGLATLFLFFIQLNFLNGTLTSLAGDGKGEKVKTGTIVLNTIIWIFVYAGFYLFFFLMKRRDLKAIICVMLSFALVASQIINMFVLSVNIIKSNNNSMFDSKVKDDSAYVPTFLTTKNMTNVSKNENVVIFVIDRFDGEEYAKPAMEKYPDVFKKLNGFTYYEDTTSMYSNTYPSIAYMLTGVEKKEVNRRDYLDRAYKENKTISELANNDFDINLYTEIYYAYDDAFNLPKYVTNIEKTTKENIITEITFVNRLLMGVRFLQVSLYRSLPVLMKDLCGSVSSTTFNGLVELKAKNLQNDICSSDMKKVFDQISNNKFNLIEKNNFAFIHFTGCHSVDYNLDWEKTNSKDINISVLNSFNIINTYIRKMKELDDGENIYKNSTIIITGDHGHIESDYSEMTHEVLTGFLVKPKGVDDSNINPIDCVSNKPVSHEDLWKTIFENEGITTYDKERVKGYNIVDNSIPNDRERHYYLTIENLVHSSYKHLYYSIKGNGAFKNWDYIDERSVSYKQFLYD